MQQNAGYGADVSPASAGKREKNTHKRSLTALTIAQLARGNEESKTAGRDALYVDGHELNHVRLAGRITNVYDENESGACVITVDDCTGSVTLKQYSSDDPAWIEVRPRLGNGSAVTVILRTSMVKQEATLSVASVSMIEDANELIHHQLQSLHEALVRKNGPMRRGGDGAASSASGAGAVGGGMAYGSFGALAAGSSSAGGYGMPMGGSAAPASAEQEKMHALLEAFRSDSDDSEGMRSEEALNRVRQSNPGLANSINRAELGRLLEMMQTEGHLYATVDENTFRAT